MSVWTFNPAASQRASPTPREGRFCACSTLHTLSFPFTHTPLALLHASSHSLIRNPNKSSTTLVHLFKTYSEPNCCCLPSGRITITLGCWKQGVISQTFCPPPVPWPVRRVAARVTDYQSSKAEGKSLSCSQTLLAYTQLLLTSSGPTATPDQPHSHLASSTLRVLPTSGTQSWFSFKWAFHLKWWNQLFLNNRLFLSWPPAELVSKGREPVF